MHSETTKKRPRGERSDDAKHQRQKKKRKRQAEVVAQKVERAVEAEKARADARAADERLRTEKRILSGSPGSAS